MKVIWISVSALLLLVNNGIAQTASDENTNISLAGPDSLELVKWLNTQKIKNYLSSIDSIYTWTTKEQVEELKKGGPLLSRSTSQDGRISLFDSIIQQLPENHEAKALFQDTKYQKKRFGWTNMWAASLGTGNENYGDQLLKINLKSESVIAYVTQKNGKFSIHFKGLNGNYIYLRDMKNWRPFLAGVLFVHCNTEETKVSEKCQLNRRYSTLRHKGSNRIYKCEVTSKEEPIQAPHREFVLLNESMVESYFFGGKQLKMEMENTVKHLEALSLYTDKSTTIQRILEFPEIKYPYHRLRKKVKYETVHFGFESYLASEMLNRDFILRPGFTYNDITPNDYDHVFYLYIQSLCFSHSDYIPTAENLLKIANTITSRIPD